MNAAFVDDSKKQTEQVLEAKYQLFGGNPRQIFTSETVEYAKGRIDCAMKEVPLITWNSVNISNRYIHIPPHVPSVLVKYTESAAPGRRYDVSFASHDILRLLYKDLYHSSNS